VPTVSPGGAIQLASAACRVSKPHEGQRTASFDRDVEDAHCRASEQFWWCSEGRRSTPNFRVRRSLPTPLRTILERAMLNLRLRTEPALRDIS